MIYDVLRFNTCATRFLLHRPPNGEQKEWSIGEYLAAEGYSEAFREHYLVVRDQYFDAFTHFLPVDSQPMTAAIWSTPPEKCFDDFPARTLVRIARSALRSHSYSRLQIQFMHNHHLLQVLGKPSWLTIEGGSHNYVKAILSKLPPAQLHLSTPITALETRCITEHTKPKVYLKTHDGTQVEYDHVVMACHSDTALQILKSGNATVEEERILGMFEWNKNEVVLHSDPAVRGAIIRGARWR